MLPVCFLFAVGSEISALSLLLRHPGESRDPGKRLDSGSMSGM